MSLSSLLHFNHGYYFMCLLSLSYCYIQNIIVLQLSLLFNVYVPVTYSVVCLFFFKSNTLFSLKKPEDPATLISAIVIPPSFAVPM